MDERAEADRGPRILTRGLSTEEVAATTAVLLAALADDGGPEPAGGRPDAWRRSGWPERMRHAADRGWASPARG